MCMGGTPKAPAPPPPPPDPPEQPKMVDAAVQQARGDERMQARAAAGRSGSIKTDLDVAGEESNSTNRSLLG